MNRNELRPDMPSQHKIKPVNEKQMKAFGLTRENVQIVESLEILEKSPPNIVIADCIRNIKFIQNFFKEQTLKKKQKYIMGLGVFQQLHYDLERNVKILKPSNVKFKNFYRPYKGQNLDGKTLVVSRHGGIGDLIFILPNLAYLKKKYPTCTIKFACGPQYQSMVENWDCVDQVLDLPFTLQHFVISDYHSFFEGVIERCKEAETTNAYNLFSKWMGLDLPDELLIPKQNPKPEKVEECRKILNNWNLKSRNVILMQLKASSIIRCPNPELWIKLIDELTEIGHDILITDSPKQSAGIDRFITRLKNREKAFNFCKYSNAIDMTIAMASISKLIISTDSGLMHIGASLGIPIFGIYGPFPGFIRLKTYPKELCDWVDAQDDCTPCFRHGSVACVKAMKRNIYFSPCYDNISVKEVVEKVERLLKR